MSLEPDDEGHTMLKPEQRFNCWSVSQGVYERQLADLNNTTLHNL